MNDCILYKNEKSMIFKISILSLHLTFTGTFLNVYDGRRVKTHVKNNPYLSLSMCAFSFICIVVNKYHLSNL